MLFRSQLPEVVAIEQFGEALLLGAEAEAFEGGQGDVFGIDGLRPRAPQPALGLADQPGEIALPQLLDGPIVDFSDGLRNELPFAGRTANVTHPMRVRAKDERSRWPG